MIASYVYDATGLGYADIYDRYGNRYQENAYSRSSLTPQYSVPSGNNWIPQFTYDAAVNTNPTSREIGVT